MSSTGQYLEVVGQFRERKIRNFEKDIEEIQNSSRDETKVRNGQDKRLKPRFSAKLKLVVFNGAKHLQSVRINEMGSCKDWGWTGRYSWCYRLKAAAGITK